MAVNADFALVSPSGRNAAPGVAGGPQLGLAFATLLGQVAPVTARTPLPARVTAHGPAGDAPATAPGLATLSCNTPSGGILSSVGNAASTAPGQSVEPVPLQPGPSKAAMPQSGSLQKPVSPQSGTPAEARIALLPNARPADEMVLASLAKSLSLHAALPADQSAPPISAVLPASTAVVQLPPVPVAVPISFPPVVTPKTAPGAAAVGNASMLSPAGWKGRLSSASGPTLANRTASEAAGLLAPLPGRPKTPASRAGPPASVTVQPIIQASALPKIGAEPFVAVPLIAVSGAPTSTESRSAGAPQPGVRLQSAAILADARSTEPVRTTPTLPPTQGAHVTAEGVAPRQATVVAAHAAGGGDMPAMAPLPRERSADVPAAPIAARAAIVLPAPQPTFPVVSSGQAPSLSGAAPSTSFAKTTGPRSGVGPALGAAPSPSPSQISRAILVPDPAAQARPPALAAPSATDARVVRPVSPLAVPPAARTSTVGVTDVSTGFVAASPQTDRPEMPAAPQAALAASAMQPPRDAVPATLQPPPTAKLPSSFPTLPQATDIPSAAPSAAPPVSPLLVPPPSAATSAPAAAEAESKASPAAKIHASPDAAPETSSQATEAPALATPTLVSISNATPLQTQGPQAPAYAPARIPAAPLSAKDSGALRDTAEPVEGPDGRAQPAAAAQATASRDAAPLPQQPDPKATLHDAADETGAASIVGGASTAAPAGPPQAAPSPAAPAAPTPTPMPQPPAAQLANAVASLHVGPDGSSHVTIRLDPAELGHLQIRISRAADGTASVDVSVERPDTLATLQNDLGHLHQALDQAGLPEQRSITMHLAAQPDQSGGTTFGTGAGSGFTPQGGFQQNGRQPHAPAQNHAFAAMPAAPPPIVAPPRPAAIAGSGVNITA